jgi:acyl-CoA thioester hydrolase
LFTVIEANIRYKAPAHYNDLLNVESTVTEVTPTTILFTTEVKNEHDALLVIGDVRVACVKTSGHPTRIPEEISKAIRT